MRPDDSADDLRFYRGEKHPALKYDPQPLVTTPCVNHPELQAQVLGPRGPKGEPQQPLCGPCGLRVKEQLL